ncbi:carboxyl transferase domain-containing protein [Raineyella fluvialis]|uniref:Acetyl-CoA carboxyl transferase n=1 Tax=Raineyella fluvialis TaxID=2662261 RepID=A0A5Q2FEY4_9ACTN|nr:carboxyl transferase domain-containing protein [Raineyella fluvialis]QGF23653.1 acetyl-CoA carboxyl transferase [Raineyella fluvialis]
MAKRWRAQELVDLVVDPGSQESWDEPIDLSGYPPDYRDQVLVAREKSGMDEAVITGRATIEGRPMAYIIGDFRFLGGSIGRDTAIRIEAAVRRATAEKLPLIASTSSGGTRMQEGTPAFVRMVSISRAIIAHKDAGLPYIVHQRHPTTGGVFASWGSLGHITVAEPEAMLGFLGPRVYEVLNDRPFPEGVQVAENLVDHGIIDAIVAPEELRAIAATALRVLTPIDLGAPREKGQPCPLPPREGSVWESIEVTRRSDRPGIREVLRYAASDVLTLSGTGAEHGPGMLLALARLDGLPCVIVGQDRHIQMTGGPLGPAGLRAAQRGIRLAEMLGLPLVTIVDTPGADLSPEAEEGALAGEISRTLAWLARTTVPSVSMILGQGTGGGALAMMPADRMIAMERAWLSPLPPEGASAIVYKDGSHARELSELQRVGAQEMLEDGIIHRIVAEPVDPAAEPREFARRAVDAITEELREVAAAKDHWRAGLRP